MRLRVLDLDGSLRHQQELLGHWRPQVVSLRDWGPRIRMACGFRRYRCFERELAGRLGSSTDDSPAVTLYGSGDFHHVSLALVRRQRAPFNLLVLDNHPDWMRGLPFLHCGTWLGHAARLENVRNIFHVGGDVDFDNYYRWMAPWELLCGGRIITIPARREYRKGAWKRVRSYPLHRHAPADTHPDSSASTPPGRRRWDSGANGATACGPECEAHLERILRPWTDELSRFPLYVSLDKDVMPAAEAPVNWDSGYVGLADVKMILRVFLRRSGGRLAGMDVLGDWSPVRVRGLFRRLLHLTEHPGVLVDAQAAAARNERTNRSLLETVASEWRDAVARPLAFANHADEDTQNV